MATRESLWKRIIALLDRLGIYLVLLVSRFILSLRYDVTLKGGEKLKNLKGPILVLPNHTSYLDPALVLCKLERFILLRPMVFEESYRNLFVFPIMKLIGAVEIPDLAKVDKRAFDQTLAILTQLEKDFQNGACLLVYPSGRLQDCGYERIGPTRSAADLLTACPTATVVLVRTSGLWGSMFGFAPTGSLPSLTKSLLKGGAILMANLIFFAPRRKVLIEVEVKDPSQFPGLSREVLNPFLEAWYNLKNPEGGALPVYVPYHALFGPRTFDFPPMEKKSIIRQNIDTAIQGCVNQMIEEHIHRPLLEFEKTAECRLESLGLDSLDRMELTLTIEQDFDFACHRDIVPTTVGELWSLAQGEKASVQRDKSDVLHAHG